MNKYILGIDGMRCGMCEAHVEETIRKVIRVNKIKASHAKNSLIAITEDELTIDDFKKVLDLTGYIVTSFTKVEAIKSLFGWR